MSVPQPRRGATAIRSIHTVGIKSVPKTQRSKYLELYVLGSEKSRLVKEMLALLEQEQKRYDDPSPLTVANPKPSAWTPPAAGGKDGGNASSVRARRKKGG